MRRPRFLALAAALVAVLTACGAGGSAQIGTGEPPPTTASPGVVTSSGTEPGPGPNTTAPPADDGSATTAPPGPGTTAPRPTNPPPPPSGLATVQVKLTRIATFTDPVAMALRPGDGALYIAEKRGRVRAIRGTVDPTPVLDIAADVSTGTEQGLLGLAFSPDGKLYVSYADTDGDVHIAEYAMVGGQADPASRREVLFIDHPFPNNYGGSLVFGPDGRLWIGLGDGSGGGDPANNAQSLNTLLGKMLRIDPRPNGSAPYTVPGDNPFVGKPDARPEVWAYGLRNPRRFSFDRQTGDLWIGDVGQNAREEVDFQPAGVGGQNYGWARLEGTRPFSGTAPANAVGPIIDYGRAGGNCGVTGGYVYRGGRVPGLAGAYVYADSCVGQLQAVRQAGGQVVDQRAFSVVARSVTSFGQDQAGELYVLSQEGGIFRIDAG